MRDVGRNRLSYSPSLTDARMNAMMDSWGRPIQTGPEHLVVHPHAALIGERLRRKRIGSGLTQAETVAAVENPRGGNYSTGLLSRMERGWANSPLYTFTSRRRLTWAPVVRLARKAERMFRRMPS
jgi:hypothetical protein